MRPSLSTVTVIKIIIMRAYDIVVIKGWDMVVVSHITQSK